MTGPRFSIFAAAAVFDERLTATDMRVLAALGTHSNTRTGVCFVSQVKLAKRLALSRSTLTAAIAKLVATGYVTAEARFSPSGAKRASAYTVVIDRPAEAGPGDDWASDEDTEEPTPMSAQPDIPMSAQPDIPMSAQPDIPMSAQPDIIERAPTLNEPPSLRSGAARAKARKKQGVQPGQLSEARRLVAEVKPLMSQVARDKRTRPKLCDDALPPLIEKHGFDAVLRAARQFYLAPYSREDDGKYQPGLQEIAKDGRLEALIPSPLEAAANRARLVKRFATGQLSNWDSDMAERYGPPPTQAEIDAVLAHPPDTAPIANGSAGGRP